MGWNLKKIPLKHRNQISIAPLQTHRLTYAAFLHRLRPLFPGANEVDQIAKIHDVLGTPSQTLLNRLKK